MELGVVQLVPAPSGNVPVRTRTSGTGCSDQASNLDKLATSMSRW